MGKTSQFLVTEDPVHRHDCGLNQGEPIDDDSSKQKDTFKSQEIPNIGHFESIKP